MFFRQLPTKEATLSYLFGCGSCHVAIAVDPVLGDEQWFIDEAAKQDVKITHVIDTHVHADHYSGGRKLAELTGAAYCLHESNAGRVQFPFEALQDGQRIEVGNVYVDVLHTPGHTPDSVLYLIDGHAATGDTLFVGECGRVDLPESDPEAMYTSLLHRVVALDDAVVVLPGHDYGPTPTSTIGREKRENYTLRPRTREEFLRFLAE